MRLTSMKKRLGNILVDTGIITPEQLAEALEIQKGSGEKLGTILARMGAINEEVMLAFLGKQCGVSYVSLAEFGEVPPEVLRSVPESVVRHQNLLPIAIDGNTVTVAMSDPFNVFAVDDIKVMTGCEVQVVIASEQQIRSAIARYYAHQPSMERDLMTLVPGKNSRTPDDEAARAFLQQALAARASMVFLDPQPAATRVRFRVDGHLQERAFLSRELAALITKKLMSYASRADAPRVPFNGKFQANLDGAAHAFRIAVIPTVQGERLVLHLDDAAARPRQLEALGFEPETLFLYQKSISRPGGLVLISGPSRSGKTSTLYSTLSGLSSPDRDLVSLEETAESVLPGIPQVVCAGGISPAESLRMLLCQDPDILAIDIAFDRETAETAFAAARDGKLVLATMQANGSAEAVCRLLQTGIEPFAVASALVLSLHQRLLRAVCPSCKEPYEIPAGALRSTGIEPGGAAADNKVSLWRGKGCAACDATGYKGRTAVFELLTIDEDMRSLILERAGEASLREAFARRGSPTLRDAALQKVIAGTTTVEEMMHITKHPV